MKNILICPHIHTIHGNVKRNIADYPNTLRIGIGFQFEPLPEKYKLQKTMKINFSMQLFKSFLNGIPIALDQFFIPGIPYSFPMLCFQ